MVCIVLRNILQIQGLAKVWQRLYEFLTSNSIWENQTQKAIIDLDMKWNKNAFINDVKLGFSIRLSLLTSIPLKLEKCKFFTVINKSSSLLILNISNIRENVSSVLLQAVIINLVILLGVVSD